MEAEYACGSFKGFTHLVLEDEPRPEPGAGEVLVRIMSCGICATDYKAIKGIRKNVEFPLIPGHEPAGVIAAVGAFVRNVKEGDEVIVSPSGFCGVCRNCRLGLMPRLPQAITWAWTCGRPVRPPTSFSGATYCCRFLGVFLPAIGAPSA